MVKGELLTEIAIIMNNLSSLSSFTEMQVADREGLRRRFGLKRFREDLDNEAIEALIGAEGDREVEKDMIAKHYGITRDRLSQIEQGQGGVQRVVSAPGPERVVFVKDDTDRQRLQKELNEANAQLNDARARLREARDEITEDHRHVEFAQQQLNNLRYNVTSQPMDSLDIVQGLDNVTKVLRQVVDPKQKPYGVPLVTQED
jgi:hypothetical protein